MLTLHVNGPPGMHVFVNQSDLRGGLKELKREHHGMGYALIMAMSSGVQFDVLNAIFGLFSSPGLIRQNAAFHKMDVCR